MMSSDVTNKLTCRKLIGYNHMTQPFIKFTKMIGSFQHSRSIPSDVIKLQVLYCDKKRLSPIMFCKSCCVSYRAAETFSFEIMLKI